MREVHNKSAHVRGRAYSCRALRQGFTLVELLVVIGIIAILLALLMPSMTRARAHAKKVACQSNLRQIGQAMLMYANMNRGWMFPPENGLIVPPKERWFVYVLKPPTPLDPESVDAKDWTPLVMLCPADDTDPVEYHSYIINHHLCEHKITYSSKPPAGLTTTAVIVAGEKVTQQPNYYVEVLSGVSTYYAQVENYRHGLQLGSNHLFLDMHVGLRDPKTPVFGEDPWDFPDRQ